MFHLQDYLLTRRQPSMTRGRFTKAVHTSAGSGVTVCYILWFILFTSDTFVSLLPRFKSSLASMANFW